MKMLLYCTKSKPYLIHESGCYDSDDMCCDYNCFSVVDRQELYNQDISLDETYNGKIVAECDFAVEDINYKFYDFNERLYETASIDDETLCKESCLSEEEMSNYLPLERLCFNQDKVGYAIHIKNLHIFDKPRKLSNYHISYFNKEFNMMREKHIEKAPQNMCRAFDIKDTYILISIRPEWLCKILNGEKTIEVRKKVLKEML